eukprot:GILK01003424.1.p1 GENE.GILK01003424.1~~GILK01003424.1.p1  ORF type:complete len:235 (-),score=20.34 GILK01003424.1:77-781(-)
MTFTAQDTFSLLGTITSIVLFLSGCNVMYIVYKQRSVGEFSYLPYYSMFGNCFFWVLYGIAKDSGDVMRVNFIGLGITTLYICIFNFYSGPSLRMKLFLGNVIGAGLLSVFAVLISLYTDNDVQQDVFGYTALANNVVMYGSPLKKLAEVIKTRDTSAIPLAMVFMSMASSCFWLAFGLLAEMWFVAGPNAAGVVLALAQLIILAWLYFSPGKHSIDNVDAKTSLIAEKEKQIV